MTIRTGLALLAMLFVSSCGLFTKKQRPRIVIGVVIDQMRWDYLQQFKGLYGKDGFVRIMDKGFSCNETYINYLPSYTAPGHASIYTGSIPAIHGIAGNDWYDKTSGMPVYCVADDSSALVGVNAEGAGMSPVNMLTTTITDELKLATSFKSKVYGISLKDRGSILPAGHLADAAYWYNEKAGGFVSSKFYKNNAPGWLSTFNKRQAGDSMLKLGWSLLLPQSKYSSATSDSNAYEATWSWEQAPTFPRKFDTLSEKNRRGLLKSVPAGNTYTLMMAKACIEGERMGYGNETDFLTISLSATDYVGHRFGPNSLEIEDAYLRLDRDLADFLKYLDKQYGKDNYLLFITADHGGAHNAQFLTDNHIPSGVMNGQNMSLLNEYIAEVIGVDSLVLSTENYQTTLDEAKIVARKLDREYIKAMVQAWWQVQPGVAFVLDMENMWRNTVPEPIKTMAVNGYNQKRSGCIQVIPEPGWYDNGGRLTGTTHGTWNGYDTHIPLLWYGWRIKHGASTTRVNMTDIAPTLAALLRIQAPNGNVGKPIEELTVQNKKKK